MKLRRRESTTVYRGEGEVLFDRDQMLSMVQGKTLSEARQIVKEHERTTLTVWTDREGNEAGRSFGDVVVSIEVKPANAEERKLDYLRRLREALAEVSKPGATPEAMAAALALQIEYQEFLSQLED